MALCDYWRGVMDGAVASLMGGNMIHGNWVVVYVAVVCWVAIHIWWLLCTEQFMIDGFRRWRDRRRGATRVP